MLILGDGNRSIGLDFLFFSCARGRAVLVSKRRLISSRLSTRSSSGSVGTTIVGRLLLLSTKACDVVVGVIVLLFGLLAWWRWRLRLLGLALVLVAVTVVVDAAVACAALAVALASLLATAVMLLARCALCLLPLLLSLVDQLQSRHRWPESNLGSSPRS